MKVIDVTDRIIELLYPTIDEVVDELEDSEIEYFIEHMVLDIQRSLYNWNLKKKTK